jgi:hypothetical protein
MILLGFSVNGVFFVSISRHHDTLKKITQITLTGRVMFANITLTDRAINKVGDLWFAVILSEDIWIRLFYG